MAYETSQAGGLCTNEALHGSMFCGEHQLTPEMAERMERRFGRLRICTACNEGFRTKDLKQRQCPGCRRYG